MVRSRAAVIFFVNDTATPEIYTRPYTLSLHDALPIAAGPTVVARGSRPLERGHPAARPARRLSRRQERALRVREAAQSTRLRLQTLLAVSRPAPGHRRLLPALWAELALRPSFPARVPGRGPRVGREETEVTAEDPPPTVPTGARYLVIAASDRQELYEYFRRKFSRAPAIEVVRERRVADRRKRPALVLLDRRSRDQRARPTLNAELQTFGFAIVIRD